MHINFKAIVYDFLLAGKSFSRYRYSVNLSKKRTRKNDQLTKQQINEIHKFWNPIKKIYNLDDFKFFSTRTGVFSPHYIPERVYYTTINSFFNNIISAKRIDDKNFYDLLFHDVAQPKTIARRKLGGGYLSNSYSIINKDDVAKLCQDCMEVIIKPSCNSCGGHGIVFWKQSDSLESLQEIISKEDNFIIQEVLSQSKDLAKFNPTSLNTIRIMTIFSPKLQNTSLTDGTCLSAVLRMGVSGSRVDNASSGGIVCGIDADGRLKKSAFNTKGECFEVHPNTNIKFEGNIIPQFQKMKDMVFHLHARFPEFGLISWDIALNEANEPILVEANFEMGQPDFHQLTNGPIFGEYTEEILRLVYNKQ